MTPDPNPMLAAVLADPHADLPRLVFADWCDDHGQPEWGEFVRVQVAVARGDGLCVLAGRKMMDGVTPTDCGGHCDGCRLMAREQELLAMVKGSILGGLPLGRLITEGK